MAGPLPPLTLSIIVEGSTVKAAFNSVTNDVHQFGSSIESEATGASSALDGIKAHMEALQGSMETLKTIGETFLSFEAIKATTESLVEANIELQQVHFSLQAALGSTEAADTEFKFLMETCNRLGVSFEAISRQYGSITASGKAAGVTLQQNRDLFTALTEASTVFHLSSQQVNSAMLGIEQSFAQGVFRSQELRQQIGQQLPGVFENMANRVKAANGDFNKLLSEGKLTVQDYVSTLTAAIHDSYDPKSLEEASEGLNANLNRTKNSILTFKAALGSGIVQDIAITGLANFSGLLDDLADSPGLKVAQYALVAASFVALGKAGQGVVGFMQKGVAAAGEFLIANNKVAQATIAEGIAVDKLAAAATRLQLADNQLAAAQERLNALTAASVAPLTAEAAEEQRLATAAIEAAAGLREQAVAASAAAEADAANAVAASEAAGANTLLGESMGVAGAAGKGLLAVMGGVPGVILACVAALVLFVDWTDDAAKAADGLDVSSKNLAKSITATATSLQKYYALKTKLDKGELSADDAKRAPGQLKILREQAVSDAGNTDQKAAENAGRIAVLEDQLKKAQDTLDKAKKNAGPQSGQINYTTGELIDQPDPAVTQAQSDVLSLQRAVAAAKATQAAVTSVQKAGEGVRADDAVQSAQEASAKALLTAKQAADNEASVREGALGKQKTQVEQVNAEIAAAKKAYLDKGIKEDKDDQDKHLQLIADGYAKDLKLAAEQDAAKSKHSHAGEAAQKAEVKAGDDLLKQLTSIQGNLDPTAKAWATYQAAVEKATESANKAEQAHGANKATIEAEKNAVIAAAAAVRDHSIAAALAKEQKAWDDFYRSLGTPLDMDLSKIQGQFDKLNAFMVKGTADADQYAAAIQRIIQGYGPTPSKGTDSNGPPTGSTLPHYAGNQQDPNAEMNRIGDAQKSLDSSYNDQHKSDEQGRLQTEIELEQLNSSKAQYLAAEKQWDDKETALATQHDLEMKNLQNLRHLAELSAASDAFSQLAQVTGDAYGQQSKQYKVMFALSKAFAIAQSAVSLGVAISKATEFGFPASLPLIAQAFALGAQVVSLIKGASFAVGGYTGDGGKYEPAGTVHKGEFVARKEVVAEPGARGFLEDFNKEGMEALHKWADTGVGYAGGGYVGAPSTTDYSSTDDASPSGGSRGPTVVAPVQVNIRNESGGEVTAKQSQKGDGSQLLDIIIGQVVQESRPGGKVSRTLEQSFVMQRKGNSYGK